MSLEDLLGRTVALRVQRFGSAGAFLALDGEPAHGDELLLPRAEVPEPCEVGDVLDAFVYLDSEDRPIATTMVPALERGEVAFLVVTALTQYGAFVDWGLPKELLVPFKEQTRELAPGDFQPFGLFLDKSGRLAATMRIREMLEYHGDFTRDEWVEGEAWRKEPGLGVFVILERRFVGLLPEHEPHRLKRGERASFRIANVLPDGKLELSLRGLGHEEIHNDAERVLRVISAPTAPAVSDHSSPEEIRAIFGLSKKAFKRAVGRLLKEGEVELDVRGFVRRTNVRDD